jgi:hypothetical protein
MHRLNLGSRNRRPLWAFLALFAPMCVLLTVSCRSGAGGEKSETGTDRQKLQQQLVEARHRETVLQQESKAARKLEPYLVVDLTTRELALKAKGRVLRSFRIKDVVKPDENIPDDPQVLLKVEPLQDIVRPKIKPGEGEAATAEASQNEVWGLHRMPQDYNLVCGSGMILEIRALAAQRSSSNPIALFKNLYRKTLDRLRQRNSTDSAQHPIIQLWMEEEDCRLLAWSLPKHLYILIL